MLFTFTGGTGHLLPLVPIAGAAQAAGHVVAFAGQAAMVPAVEAAGFTAFDTGGATLLATTKRMELLAVDMEREARVMRESFARRIARERAGAVLSLCREWRPDLLVWDEIDFGTAVVAERLRLPHASVLCIASGSFVSTELVTEPLNELRAEHGLSPDPKLEMLRRHLVLSPFPPSLRDPAAPLPPTAHSIRPGCVDLPFDESRLRWLLHLAEAPTVYVTLGTIFNLESGDLFDRLLAGVRDLPVNVVVTVGSELDPQELGAQPPNVHVERYIPQSLLLPSCSLVVCHGGSGSIVGALAHGLPMVLLPIGADQPLNARRCEQLGLARTLDALRATSERVRQVVSAVLAEPRYRRSAGRLRAEIAALPGPEHAVTLLERIATRA